MFRIVIKNEPTNMIITHSRCSAFLFKNFTSFFSYLHYRFLECKFKSPYLNSAILNEPFVLDTKFIFFKKPLIFLKLFKLLYYKDIDLDTINVINVSGRTGINIRAETINRIIVAI